MVTLTARPALDEAEKKAVADAIGAAEARTAGEVYCVVARSSGEYAGAPILVAALMALAIPAALLAGGVDFAALSRMAQGAWTVGHGAREDAAVFAALSLVLVIQIAILALGAWAASNPAVRLAMTPAPIRRAAVHRRALEQFLAHGIDQTAGRTGVLIYVSLAEHIAEVVADSGIHTRADAQVWRDAIATVVNETREGRLGRGLVLAIGQVGDVLAAHFPPEASDEDELPDRVVLI